MIPARGEGDRPRHRIGDLVAWEERPEGTAYGQVSYYTTRHADGQVGAPEQPATVDQVDNYLAQPCPRLPSQGDCPKADIERSGSGDDDEYPDHRPGDNPDTELPCRGGRLRLHLECDSRQMVTGTGARGDRDGEVDEGPVMSRHDER